ncbi:MarR family winged helix-turn-helix transcriptional regulator [Homoserinibacter sp. YIM 151385]|uniref:MarR family winged helix-turn-helix transcriptional regulator n=1 Tax=Homoserinibacter sp. YIM 151385 TaxID=2985506 RepID=UPI0022F08282|nr:MarR family transcriptional regulator [Homoserinibacter sp. YIM 151385]WBU37208.1 MarR family transcriptional regulator [Homoserinibacter sp. YIM 151385]
MTDEDRIHLPSSLGYLLKEAASALRIAMEDVLRPLHMTVTRYSCLELLAQRPGLSGSELARGAFITRQSMGVLLQSLEEEGLVARAETPAVGKALPAELTALGRERLRLASAAVRGVELRMLDGMGPDEQRAAFELLQRMTRALRDLPEPSAPPGPEG